MKKVFFIFACLLILASCDEIDKIFNPTSDDYLIKKTIQASSEEQIIESGSEFKMIFPANSISGDLEVKVKKETSVPAMNIPNQKPGKNFYRIKFSGDAEFLQPVKLIINYDKSAIPTGKTAQESVFGYIYSSGAWKLAVYQLDEPNGKIIISKSSILGKTYKDEPVLLDDGEFILGIFTSTDEGQKDAPPYDCQWGTPIDYSQLIKVDDGDRHLYYRNKEGKRHGVSLKWYDKERKKLEQAYCNYEGKFQGLWTQWYENGNKWFESNYDNGLIDGLTITWYESGAKKNEINYLAGQYHGLHIIWFEDGLKQYEANYQHNLLHGRVTEWHSNGNKFYEGDFNNGKKDGFWITYYVNGNKVNEGNYKDGVSVGIWIYYDENGICERKYDYDNKKNIPC